MSAAKLGLPAPLRVFYDELEPHGDWVLVEPLGWVFRPRVNTVAWRPYQEGRWSPSYSYGWVWESDEPFGWITDHYGFWFHDEFQGWVWQPNGAWAPSWVAWVQVGDYVGWAPLPPQGVDYEESVPGGVFTYTSRQVLASGVSSVRGSYLRDLPDDTSTIRPISRVAYHHGVYWNAGPDPAELLGQAQADRLRLDERDGRITPLPTQPGPMTNPPELRLSTLEDRTTRTWSAGRREILADRARRHGTTPGSTGVRVQGGAASPPAGSDPSKYKPTSPDDSTLGTAPVDSLKKRRVTRPGTPKTPRQGPP